VVDTLLTSFPVINPTNGAGNDLAPSGRRLLIFAGSSDKDLAGMFQVLAPHFAQAYLTRYGNKTRSATPEELLELWRRTSDHPAMTFASAAEAWQVARAAAQPDDLICVTGSVFLAGELRPMVGIPG
jgi:dihydrofolate synthase/folylpolyglutamate synthase